MLCLHYVPGWPRQPVSGRRDQDGIDVMGREGTGYANVIVVDAGQDINVLSRQSRFDHGGLKRGYRGRREHSVNAALHRCQKHILHD